ncbi:MAG: DUF1127 domain-containing protein [Litoreibacter sp.]
MTQTLIPTMTCVPRRTAVHFDLYRNVTSSPIYLSQDLNGPDADPRSHGHKDRKATSMIDTVVRKYQNWKRFRTTYDELSQLSNRELNDLGISRADIARHARGSMR